MIGKFLFHLFQLLTHRFAFLLFQRFTGVFLKGGGHNIHILGLKKDQILCFALLFHLFQTIINAIFPGYPVKRLDIIVCDNDVRDLRAALLQALDALPPCFLSSRLNTFAPQPYGSYFEKRGATGYGLMKYVKKCYSALDGIWVLTNSDKTEFDNNLGIESKVLYNPLPKNDSVSTTYEEGYVLFAGRLEREHKGLFDND